MDEVAVRRRGGHVEGGAERRALDRDPPLVHRQARTLRSELVLRGGAPAGPLVAQRERGPAAGRVDEEIAGARDAGHPESVAAARSRRSRGGRAVHNGQTSVVSKY